MRHLRRVIPVALVGLGLSVLTTNPVGAGPYVQTDLVSDIPGLATITDPELVNPWGASHSTTSPFWTSNQGTNTATLYAVTASTNVSKTIINPPSGFVAIPPPPAGGPQGPTGQVNNTNTSSFLVGNGGNGAFAHFIFANLNGTISAWDTGTTAFIQVPSAGASYTGLAINQADTQLYAANDAGTGSINVFSSSFAPLNLGPGAFATPPAISASGLVPFNVQDLNGDVYVTYAPAGRSAQQSATAGMGAVAIFTENGTLLQTLIGSQLAAPWGIALAPAGFGPFGGDLLVGNFSYVDSEINAFNPISGAFLGTIPIGGPAYSPGGLWFLGFGSGGSNGSPNTLYITDGIDGETHGLFAAINPAPEPNTLLLLGAGMLSLFAWRWGRSARARSGIVG